MKARAEDLHGFLLQVAAHPKDRKQNTVGHAIGGPALLQIWRIGEGLPSLALALCLQGGVVWDCEWQPGLQPSHSSRRAFTCATASMHVTN